MTLPSSGPISLQQIQAEFGGNAPIAITEYYGVAPGVPTSGPISLADFYGKSATPLYAFTPVYPNSGNGTATAGNGMPIDYTPAEYGTVIWPTGQGVLGTGWVGMTFVATTTTTNFKFVADNNISVYFGTNFGTTLVASSANLNVWAVGSATTVPGRSYTVSLLVNDTGTIFGTSGKVYDSGGNTIVTTNNSWVSA